MLLPCPPLLTLLLCSIGSRLASVQGQYVDVITLHDAGGNTQAPARAARQEDQSTQVRGAAGQAAAAIRGVKAPTALVNAKGNWLITMGSKVMKQRQRRVLVAEGEELKLPEGVTASQATGKLHFAVTFKFNEV